MGWARQNYCIFLNRDWKRAKKMLAEGLMYDRPGIVVIHSPKGSAKDLTEGVDAFLSLRATYDQTWAKVFYLSHGVCDVYLASGSKTTLAAV